MGKGIIAVFFGLALTAGIYSQPRLAPPNDPNAAAGRGQSEIIFNAEGSDRDIAVWVNDVIAAHVFPGTREKILVRDGRNIIEAAETISRNGQWVLGDRKRVAVDSASSRVTIGVTTRYSRFMGLNIQGSVAIAPQGRGGAAAVTGTMPARPAGGGSSIEDAVINAAETLTGALPEGATLAIISISSGDPDMAEFVMEELAYLVVETRRFRVVDRKSLDVIRTEHNFQVSGDVDDNSAVSIGKMLGASIVITGSISGSGATRRLRAKALDVMTAEIVSMASERF